MALYLFSFGKTTPGKLTAGLFLFCLVFNRTQSQCACKRCGLLLKLARLEPNWTLWGVPEMLECVGALCGDTSLPIPAVGIWKPLPYRISKLVAFRFRHWMLSNWQRPKVVYDVGDSNLNTKNVKIICNACLPTFTSKYCFSMLIYFVDG